MSRLAAFTADQGQRVMDATRRVEHDLPVQEHVLPSFRGKRERGTPQTLFRVDLTLHTSSPGTDTTECAHTYDFAIGTTDYTNISMTGHGQRMPIGAMTAGGKGLVSIEDGEAVLFWADEQPEVGVCDDSGTDPFLF